MPNSPSATLPLPRLDDDGICDHCVRGLHRMCRHPDCECVVANAGAQSHANRPRTKGARDKGTPHSQGEPAMTATAPLAAVPPPKKKATFVPPNIAIRKVDALPEAASKQSLTKRVVAELEAANLEAGEWYEVLTYTTAQGSSNAATRFSKQDCAAGYEFVARGLVVYVRVKSA